MKTLLLLLIPCLAFGRVGERLDDFKKRSGEQFEVEQFGSLFRATSFIDKIDVQLIGKDGVILFEFYRGVTFEQANEIVSKLPNKFQIIENGAETEWRDGVNKLSCFHRKDSLLIRYDSAVRYREIIDKLREAKPPGRKMEKF